MTDSVVTMNKAEGCPGLSSLSLESYPTPARKSEPGARAGEGLRSPVFSPTPGGAGGDGEDAPRSCWN